MPKSLRAVVVDRGFATRCTEFCFTDTTNLVVFGQITDPISALQVLRDRLAAMALDLLLSLVRGDLYTFWFRDPFGNWRAAMNMAQGLLLAAAAEERIEIDEQLYFEVFAPAKRPRGKKRKPANAG